MCMKFIYWIIFCVFCFIVGVYYIIYDCIIIIIVLLFNCDSVCWGR